MLLPDAAIGTDQAERFVLVVDGENKVARKKVVPGPMIEGFRIVREGVTPADRVVVAGLQAVHPGSVVDPQDAPLQVPERFQSVELPENVRIPDPPAPADASAGRAMNVSRFFIDRPIFATVLSIVIVIVGVVAYGTLPVAQYPDVVPPTIVVNTSYPGANARGRRPTTVATPLEQEINGVEDMLYMSSQCTSDGSVSLTITFQLGTDLDTAQVLVQNRVAIAEPRLPEEVRRIGVTTRKSSPDLLIVVHMVSPSGRYDQLYISNYALLQVRDVLARVDGVGDVTLFGAARLQHARVARPRPDRGARHDGGRRRRSAPRAERAGRGGSDRPAARATRDRVPAHGQHARPPRRGRRVREHRDPHGRRRPHHAPSRRGARRARRARLLGQQLPLGRAGRGDGDRAAARLERARHRGAHPRRDEGALASTSRRGSSTRSSTTRPCSSPNRSAT